MSRKKTTEWLIQASKEKFGERIDYSNTIYRNAKVKIEFRCIAHDNIFYQTSNNHLKSKHPCAECLEESKRSRFSDELIDFKRKIKQVHGDIFSFEKTEYINQRTEVTLICRKHKIEVKRRPYVFLRGSGCPKCKAEEAEINRSRQTLLEINKYIEQFNGKCHSERYIDVFLKLDFECANGHQFSQSWKAVKDAMRCCPECSPNKLIGESLARQMLEHLLDFKLPSKYIQEMEGLQLDGYNVDAKIAFEYQGYQHSSEESHFHKNKRQYKMQLARDNRKKELCKKNGIQLIEIFEFKTIRANRIGLFYKQVKDILDSVGINYDNTPFSIDLVELYHGKESDLYERAKKVVELNQGKIQPYIGSESKHIYYCAKGHKVSGRVLSVIVKSNASCPICEEKDKFNRLKQILEERGGQLIESKIKSNGLADEYNWLCHKGHKNKSKGFHLTQGIWCKKCQIENSKFHLDDTDKQSLKTDLQIGDLFQKDILTKYNISGTALRQFIKDNDITPNYKKRDPTKQKKKTKGKLLQINPETFEVVHTYESLEAVKRSKENIFTPGGIRYQMKQGKKAYGFYWCREGDYESLLKTINNN